MDEMTTIDVDSGTPKKETDEEIEVRIKKQYKDLPDGYYNIGVNPYVAGTGREGYINFQIALAKHVRDM